MEKLQIEYNQVVGKYREVLDKESTQRQEDDRGKRLEEENAAAEKELTLPGCRCDDAFLFFRLLIAEQLHGG